MSPKKSLQKKSGKSHSGRNDRARYRLSRQGSVFLPGISSDSSPLSLHQPTGSDCHDSDPECLRLRLHRSETLLAHAEEIANLGIWDFDCKTGELSCSRGLAKILGIPEPSEPITIAAFASLLRSGNASEIEQRLRQIAASGEVRFRYSELEIPNRHSRIRRTVYIPAMDENGSASRVFGITQDVTSEKSAEEEMRRLSHRLLTLRNDEQRRMARNLHETASQTLAALQFTLGKIGRAIPRGASRAVHGIKAARTLVEDALREIRSVCSLLHPPSLEEAGLAAALLGYTRAFSERSGVRFHSRIPVSLLRMSREVEITLFRVVQEALTNVHRHSKAKRCWLTVRQTPERVSLQIRDDGMGLRRFDETAFASAPIGVGIAGMRERIKQLRGTFEIQSARRRGTTVTVEIPIKRRDAKRSDKE
jgi:signal transduction histidine kinase